MAGARGAVLRLGRPAQRRLQAGPGRHEPLSRRLQQPQSRFPAAVRASRAGGGRTRVSRCARRAARPREPHAEHVLPAECRNARRHPAAGRHARAHRLAERRHQGADAGGAAGRRVAAVRADRAPWPPRGRRGLRSVHGPAEQRPLGGPARDSRRYRPADRAAAVGRLVQPPQVAPLRGLPRRGGRVWRAARDRSVAGRSLFLGLRRGRFPGPVRRGMSRVECRHPARAHPQEVRRIRHRARRRS